MNYKRICIIIGIIFVLSFLVLCVKSVKANIEIKNEVESSLGFSIEQKKGIKYKYLVDDIISVKKGSVPRHAKQDKSKNSDAVSVFAGAEYYGDGYIVKSSSGNGMIVYDFYVGENVVYTSIINTGWNLDDPSSTSSMLMSKLINYVIFGIIIVAEFIFLALYKKTIKSENEKSKEEKKSFENEKEIIEDKKSV